MKIDKLKVEIAQRLRALDKEYLSIQRLMVRYYGLHPKHIFFPRTEFLRQHVTCEDVLLDLGCGFGILPFLIASHVKKVIGVDRHPPDPQFAKQNYEHVVQDVNVFLGKGRTGYTVAFLSHILEHLEDPASALSRLTCNRVIVIVPRIESWEVMVRKDLEVEWRMDPEHYRLYSRNMLREHLLQGGFPIIDVLEFDGDNGIRAVARRMRSK